MSDALNQLIVKYLAEAHPTVAAALRKEAPASAAAHGRSPFGKKTLQEVVIAYRTKKAPVPDSSSDDDEEPAPKPAARKVSPRLAAKKAPIPDSSSDDDEEPAPKPAARKVSPRLAAKKAPVPDSSSDDDEEPAPKPAARKVSPRLAAKKAPMSDDDSDDDVPAPKKNGSAVGKSAPAREADSEPAVKVPRTEAGAPGRRTPHHLNEDGSFRRFQRIDPTKVSFHADALRDNRPGEEHLALRQNQEMMRTKGKGFNKLKQKNKGKFYGAGVDLSVRAYQFPDSDDE
ncbi:SRP40, C-terminal domain containing protein [Novymonas esmeraldas]|uniref:SRP40, C-terminal domain containing protein n=1 Tax=Novymonas esmeraldas TaxID=1808958 RepID=A0AAW0ETL5_9TRYP